MTQIRHTRQKAVTTPSNPFTVKEIEYPELGYAFLVVPLLPCLSILWMKLTSLSVERVELAPADSCESSWLRSWSSRSSSRDTRLYSFTRSSADSWKEAKYDLTKSCSKAVMFRLRILLRIRFDFSSPRLTDSMVTKRSTI